MPIYAYRCASCGFEEEALQKVSEAPLTQCSSCGKPTLEKQVTAAGFQLKGSGWYVTDFRDNGKKPEATGVAPAKKSSDAAPAGNGGGAGASSDGASSSGKSESAPAKSESTSSAPAAAPAAAPSAKPSGQ